MKAVGYAEDRSPDLRSIQPPSQSRIEWIRLQWRDGSFTCGNTRAETLFGSFASINDGKGNRCAHSCGAVADFHRLPEHPGDCSDESSCGMGRSSDGMETTSMTSTFIAASGRDVKVENCVSNKKSAFAKAAARQPSPFFFAGSPSLSRHSRAKAGDPGLIRTADLRFRKPMLYPSELRGHWFNFTGFLEHRFRKPLVDSRSGPCRAGGHLSYGATRSFFAGYMEHRFRKPRMIAT